MTENFVKFTKSTTGTGSMITTKRTSTSNTSSDAKGQFLEEKATLVQAPVWKGHHEHTLTSGCLNAQGKLEIIATEIKPEEKDTYYAIGKQREAAWAAAPFSFGNKAQDIMNIIKDFSGPDQIAFAVDGSQSVLDVLCASPEIQAVRAKGTPVKGK